MFTITTRPQQPAASSPLRHLIQRYPLLTFIALAFGLPWLFEIPDTLGSWGLIPFRIPTTGVGIVVAILVGAYGPTWAALIVTAATRGKAGIRTLLRRLLVWRVSIGWYAVALFLPALLFFLPAPLYAFLGGTPLALPSSSLVELILGVPLLFLVNMLVNGEELGWRGYALPRLQGKYSALTASLILGVIWSLFHLPLFLMHGGSVFGNLSSEPPLGFLVRITAGAVLITWVYNNTRGSVLLAILFHAAVNTWSQIFPSMNTAHVPADLLYWLGVGGFCLATVIVVVVFRPARLSRKPASEMAYVTDPVRTDGTSLMKVDVQKRLVSLSARKRS